MNSEFMLLSAEDVKNIDQKTGKEINYTMYTALFGVVVHSATTVKISASELKPFIDKRCSGTFVLKPSKSSQDLIKLGLESIATLDGKYSIAKKTTHSAADVDILKP